MSGGCEANITSQPLRERLGRARSCVFTLNNYSAADVELMRKYAKESCRYLVFGYEVAPTTGTPHLQGFVCWDTQRSLDKLANMFSKHMYVAKQKGTHKQAADYCKEDGNFEEFGELPNPGGRTDWAEVITALRTGASVMDVLDANPQLAPCQRAIREIKAMTLKPKHREVNVIVLIGNAGTGKTRYAYDKYPELYSKPRGEWWDGYTGQETILLDDYYGYLPYSFLLNVLDRYPLQVPIKGGFVHAQWDTVIITSNKPPTQWYREGLTPALRRRLKSIYLVTNTNEETELTPWNPPPPSQSSPPSCSTSCTDDPHA